MKNPVKTIFFSSIVMIVFLLALTLIIFNPFAAQVTSSVNKPGAKNAPISSPYVDGQKAKPTIVSQPTNTPAPTATIAPKSTVAPTPTTVPAVPTQKPVPPAPLVSWTNTSTTAYTINTVNVRSAPYTNGEIIKTLDAGTQVNIYGNINGEAVSNSAIWYRISDQNSAPAYIYSGLTSTEKPAPVTNTGGNSNCASISGQVVDINLSNQWATFCGNSQVANGFPITSGQPDLATPTGTYHIFSKLSPTTFYSPWPVGSPYHYEPTHINYALEFLEGGFFLHDAWWRSTFGPGTNVPHTDPQFGELTGTHGCVVMTTDQAAWLYNWAAIGTTVNIHY